MCLPPLPPECRLRGVYFFRSGPVQGVNRSSTGPHTRRAAGAASVPGLFSCRRIDESPVRTAVPVKRAADTAADRQGRARHPHQHHRLGALGPRTDRHGPPGASASAGCQSSGGCCQHLRLTTTAADSRKLARRSPSSARRPVPAVRSAHPARAARTRLESAERGTADADLPVQIVYLLARAPEPMTRTDILSALPHAGGRTARHQQRNGLGRLPYRFPAIHEAAGGTTR